MEVEQSQEYEMVRSSPKVYDWIHSTPVSLKELSAMAISLEIWRRELNKHRQSKSLQCFDLGSSGFLHIPWRDVLPDLPSTIYDVINKYVLVFGYSLSEWTQMFGKCISNDDHWTSAAGLLEHFDDFVCDYNGAIHFIKTVERMLRCDRFDDDAKFNVACAYYLEDDIQRMWPFVSINMDFDSIDFDRDPHLYYWICRLTNKLDKIILTEGNVNIDEEMFDYHCSGNVLSLQYFWNGVSRENQMLKVLDVYEKDMHSFVRIILPKLDDQQLNEFINEYDQDQCLMLELLRRYWHDERLVLKTWLYIRNVMNQSTFTNHVFMQGLLINHYVEHVKDYYEGFDGDSIVRNSYLYLCREVWNNTPGNLKRSAIRDFISGTELLEKCCDKPYAFTNMRQLNVELLLIILRCVSSAERNSFWHDCWHLLIAMARGEDLQRIMDLCFENNEREMAEFKEHVMAISRTVHQLGVRLLRTGQHFNYLNELVSFMWPEKQNERNFKQQILRSCFLGSRPRFDPQIIDSAEKFNDFITDAYDCVDLSIDFKNQLMSSSSFLKRLYGFICEKSVSAESLIEFINTFVSTEETVVQVKMRITNELKEHFTASRGRPCQRDMMVNPHFNSILLWCLGSNEEVGKFKLGCALVLRHDSENRFI